MTKGEHYTYNVTPENRTHAYVLFHSFSFTQINITYQMTRVLEPVFTQYYDWKNMTTPFFDMGFFKPKIDIYAYEDTSIIFAVYFYGECTHSTIIATNKDYYRRFESYYDITAAHRCIFGVFQNTELIQYTSETPVVTNYLILYFEDMDGIQHDGTTYSTETYVSHSSAFILGLSGEGDSQLKINPQVNNPTVRYSNSIKSYDNSIPPDDNNVTQGPIDFNETHTTGFFESANVIIIGVVAGVVCGICIFVVMYLWSKKRN